MSKEYDPHMHTAEHILNQTMIRLLGCDRSFRAHIEKKKSKCDYKFDRELTCEEVENISIQVNKIIAEDMPIEEFFVDRTEADRLYHTQKLPANIQGDIRIVKVGDYDYCPCIGPHANSTSELGSFKIISTDFNDGILRIRFKLIKESV